MNSTADLPSRDTHCRFRAPLRFESSSAVSHADESVALGERNLACEVANELGVDPPHPSVAPGQYRELLELTALGFARVGA